MEYRYLVKNRQNLVQYIATHLAPKGYIFYVTFWIPEDKDLETVDLKLILKYETHRSKFRTARKKKAGEASVKYVRCGQLGVLITTRGRSRFFEDETGYKSLETTPLVLSGYSISVNPQTKKTSVRLHREAQKRLQMFVMEWGHRRSEDWWKDWMRRFPFLAFAGVQDCQYALLKVLNATRKAFRQSAVDWKEVVRRKFPSIPLLEPTSKEVLDAIRFHLASSKSSRRAEIGSVPVKEVRTA